MMDLGPSFSGCASPCGAAGARGHDGGAGYQREMMHTKKIPGVARISLVVMLAGVVSMRR
jgi:hypothetical protein